MDADHTMVRPMADTLFLVDNKGNRIALVKELIAGRDASCDLVLTEGHCSRKHAKLKPTPLGLLITDLGSSNGTYINGQKISEQQAILGDNIAFDTVKFKLEREGVTAEATIISASEPVAVAKEIIEQVAAKVETPVTTQSAPEEAVRAEVKPAENGADAGKAGPWWVPKDEGPQGTMLIAQPIVAPAAVEGTQIMSALSIGKPVLVALTGELKGKSFPMQGDRWKIGRDSSECDIAVEDQGVSALHAQIIHENGTWKLINLMSSNGSFVNGQKVQSAYLNSGDQIRFGSTEFVFNVGDFNVANGGFANATTATTVAAQKNGLPSWLFAAVGFVLVVGAGLAWILTHKN